MIVHWERDGPGWAAAVAQHVIISPTLRLDRVLCADVPQGVLPTAHDAFTTSKTPTCSDCLRLPPIV